MLREEEQQQLQLSGGGLSLEYQHNSSLQSVLEAKSTSIPDWAEQMCDGCGDTLTSQGSLPWCSCFFPMIPAVATVPGFSMASGNAPYLTPTAFCSSVAYWPVKRVLWICRIPAQCCCPFPLHGSARSSAVVRVD